MKLFRVLGFSLFLFCLASNSVHAQRTAPEASAPAGSTVSSSSSEDRAAQLRAVVGLVTTPDRDINIANFEQIMASNDIRRVELAIRTLISGEDPILRGLAMRGYFAVFSPLIMEPEFPAEVMRIIQQARNTPDGFAKITAPHQYLRAFSNIGFKLELHFEVASINSTKGSVRSNTSDREKFEYVVRGTKMSFPVSASRFTGHSGPVCTIELTPEKNLRIVGELTCKHPYWTRAVRLIGDMF